MIRNLLYLDEQKLFSLSSQVMEGVTEYLLTTRSEESEAETTQKGPIASGRALADAIKRSSASVERRVLHDHAFALFEEKLVSAGMVVDIPEIGDPSGPPKGGSFVRVTAPATFIDASKLTQLLDEMNNIGEALAYVTNYEAIQASRAALDTVKQTSKDKSKVAQLERAFRDLSNAGSLAKAAGMQYDPVFLKNVRLLLDYGFSDHFEVQQITGQGLYSTPLKRESLREPESLLIAKYSRKTEKNLVVLGFPTQTAGSGAKQDGDAPPKPKGMKEAVVALIDKFAAVEASLAGKSVNEVVIDPIAVYVAL